MWCMLHDQDNVLNNYFNRSQYQPRYVYYGLLLFQPQYLQPHHETLYHLRFLFQMEFKMCLRWPISPCINSALARFHATYRQYIISSGCLRKGPIQKNPKEWNK